MPFVLPSKWLLTSLIALTAVALAVMLGGARTRPTHPDAPVEVPAVAREFRGVWVATVANIDWPSKRTLSTEQQKAELIALLDKAAQLHLNAIIFQVRPACDALYDSMIEPWSEYLTGQMGKAPTPYYDPLAFAVEEAHKRGLELHAWFNPYRAHHPTGRSPISANHISKTHPDMVRHYGSMMWLDPGLKSVQDYSISVVMDVVKRYDIDGVHIDDYFYPYKEKDAAGQTIPFPDDASYKAYQDSGGALNRDDWRRANVDSFIERLYSAIKAEKKWVKFGVSPFGIWRPGNPPQIKGFDSYAEIYGDSRKWLVSGWLDYCSPQLYWPIAQTPQSYPVLLQWWVQQNEKGRNIWPGNYTSRVSEGSPAWPATEIEYQIKTTRGIAGATGNVHFSAKAFLQNAGGLTDLLARGVYSQPALVPPSPWLGDMPPAAPQITTATDSSGAITLRWKSSAGPPARWVIQSRTGNAWATAILPAAADSYPIPAIGPHPDAAAVSAVDRYGIQSAPTVVKLNNNVQ